MATPKKQPIAVRVTRVTFNRDSARSDAKRLHSAELQFTIAEWQNIEKELHLFLQPHQKFENIEMIYAEDTKEKKVVADAPPAEI